MTMMMIVKGSHSFLKPPPISKRHRHPLTKATAAGTETREIRVCTNRTCRKQGSFQTLEIITDLAPPDITVQSCGCLGRCGSGPNVAVLPQGLIVNHCSTAAKAAQFMATATNASDGDISKSLEALSLRKRAQAEMDLANFSEAGVLLSQAIGLKPFGGIHIMFTHRSRARLALRNYLGALEDAREALILAPKYPDAYMCEGDALAAMEQYDAAEKSYSMRLQIDPSVRRSKSFQTRVAKLQEKITAAHVPPNQQE